jgi:hypothetical protein
MRRPQARGKPLRFVVLGLSSTIRGRTFSGWMRGSAANLFTNFRERLNSINVRSHPTPSASFIDIIEEFVTLYSYAQSNVQSIFGGRVGLIVTVIAIGVTLYVAIHLTLRRYFPPDT